MHRLVDLDVHTLMNGGIFNRCFEKDKHSKETGIYEGTTTDDEIDSVESHAATKKTIEHETGRIVGDLDVDEFEVDSKTTTTNSTVRDTCSSGASHRSRAANIETHRGRQVSSRLSSGGSI